MSGHFLLKEMSVYVNTSSIPFASLQKQSEFRPCVFQLHFLFLPRLSLSLCQLVPPCREKLCHIGSLLTFKLLFLSFSSPSFIGFELFHFFRLVRCSTLLVSAFPLSSLSSSFLKQMGHYQRKAKMTHYHNHNNYDYHQRMRHYRRGAKMAPIVQTRLSLSKISVRFVNPGLCNIP